MAEVDIDLGDARRPLVAVVCSRLGRDPNMHRHIGRYLSRSALDCRQRGGSWLVADKSAIAPWARRAAELFDVPLELLAFDSATARVVDNVRDQRKLPRDAVVITLADRVDALYVRRGGIINDSLRRRLRDRSDATTRVVISMAQNCAATELISCGAVGWYVHPRSADPDGPTFDEEREQLAPLSFSGDSWTRSEGQWLVHCTRACVGPWPGETELQYRDSMLLGDDCSTRRGPMDALARIVRSGRLVASSTATRREHPVVCFSALPLATLLQRRCFRPQLGRWDYEPFGVAIRVSAARRLGIEPVIYGSETDRDRLAPSERYRFHPQGKTFDWREELEWRSSSTVDLRQVPPDEVRIFAAGTIEKIRSSLVRCPWSITPVALPNRSSRGNVVSNGRKSV